LESRVLRCQGHKINGRTSAKKTGSYDPVILRKPTKNHFVSNEFKKSRLREEGLSWEMSYLGVRSSRETLAATRGLSIEDNLGGGKSGNYMAKKEYWGNSGKRWSDVPKGPF